MVDCPRHTDHGQPGVTPLLAVLCQRIARSGPLTVAEFMATALGDPGHGYYTTRDPLGCTGDFTTAPEISQMFGELIGLWCADLWQRSGGGPRILVELGPGRGTLIRDAMRAIPGGSGPITVHLVEISPALRQRQRQTLRHLDVTWHTSLADLPQGPSIILANEFYDALPTRQFERARDGWHERLVGFGEEDGRLQFLAGPVIDPGPLIAPDILAAAQPGDIVEHSPARLDHVTALAQRLTAQGGTALIIDYGPAHSAVGDSLQAIRAHRPAPPLAEPGQADLTTHVDFASLADAARRAGACIYGPVTQRAFLRALGIELRANTLLASAPPARRRQITSALDRLIAPDQMGILFKVLAIAHPEAPVPAGFA